MVTSVHRQQLMQVVQENECAMISSKRTPLEHNKLAKHPPTTKKNKKALRFPIDDTEFYSNIWDVRTNEPETMVKSLARRIMKKPVKRKPIVPAKYIDISQVAYVVTTMDYKQGYECGAPLTVNIWNHEIDSTESNENNNSTEAFAGSNAQELGSQCMSSKSVYFSRDSISEAHPTVPLSYRPPSRHGSISKSNYVASMIKYKEPEDSTDEDDDVDDDGDNEIRAPSSSAPAVAPPSQNGPTTVFSMVLANDAKTIEDGGGTWHGRFLLGLHEPVRHALYVIDRFLERSQHQSRPTVGWNVVEFFTWFRDYFVEYLKCQHGIKLQFLQPLLQLNYQMKHDVMDLYDEIYFVVEVIVLQEDRLVHAAAFDPPVWERRIATLQEDIRRLNKLVDTVLTVEETMFNDALRMTFNEQSFEKYVIPRLLRSMRPKRVVIPWIIERSRVWGGEKQAQVYLNQLSFTARFLYARLWHPYFVLHVAAAMKHLDTDMTGMITELASEPWFTCVLQ